MQPLMITGWNGIFIQLFIRIMKNGRAYIWVVLSDFVHFKPTQKVTAVIEDQAAVLVSSRHLVTLDWFQLKIHQRIHFFALPSVSGSSIFPWWWILIIPLSSSQWIFFFVATSVGTMLSALNIVTFYADDSLLIVSPPIMDTTGLKKVHCGYRERRRKRRIYRERNVQSGSWLTIRDTLRAAKPEHITLLRVNGGWQTSCIKMHHD